MRNMLEGVILCTRSHSCLPDVVTCIALDKAGSGDHLITGSRDTTCAIWTLGGNVCRLVESKSQYL